MYVWIRCLSTIVIVIDIILIMINNRVNLFHFTCFVSNTKSNTKFNFISDLIQAWRWKESVFHQLWYSRERVDNARHLHVYHQTGLPRSLSYKNLKRVLKGIMVITIGTKT